MTAPDFRVAWRLMKQEAGTSVLALVALAAAFAACFLLLSYVGYSFGYDRSVPEVDRVVMTRFRANIASDPRWLDTTPLPFADVAQRSGLASAASAFVPYTATTRVGDQVQAVRLAVVHPAFAEVMRLHALQGDLAALARPDALVLTQRTARRLFGDNAGVPRTLQIDGRDYTVAALLPDPPANSTVDYEGLAGIDSTIWPDDERQRLVGGWGAVGGRVYARLAPGASAAALQAALQQAADHSPLLSRLPPEMLQRLGERKPMEVGVDALRDVYFDAELAGAPGASVHGERRNVIGLAVIALLVLLLAAVNHVNLATARTLRRQREIAMRKVLGESAGGVAAQFLLESSAVATIAALAGLGLARVLLPTFSDLVDRQLGAFFTLPMALAMLAFAIAVGVLAGLYPAWVALEAVPARVLAGRGNSDTRVGAWLRRAMTVIQFAAAIGLTGATLTIAWQTRFATQRDPGFDADRLLLVQLPDDLSTPASAAFRDEVARLPGVTGVGGSAEAIGDNAVGRTQGARGAGGRSASLQSMVVTRDFFPVYGLRAAAGRLFDPVIDPPQSDEVVVLNAEAARALGYADPAAAVGQIVEIGNAAQGARVVGIAPTLRFRALRSAVAPMAYRLGLDASVLSVRVDGAPAAATAAIEGLWRRHFPNDLPRIDTARHRMLGNYADDLRLSALFAASTLIAVAIAAFGIYVLSAGSVQRRAKEIVLRKLFGAEKGAIAGLLAREFGLLVALGALAGIPPALVVGSNYLAGYAERAPIGPWSILAALAIALVIAFVSILRHSLRALDITPADALRL